MAISAHNFIENMYAFTHDEVNCWEYCAKWAEWVQGADTILGSNLNAYNQENLTSARSVSRKFSKHKDEWNELPEPIDHCLVVIRVWQGLHTAIFFQGFLHHMSESANSQRVEPVENYDKAGKIVGYFTRKI